MKKLILFFGVIAFIACEEEECPEGTIELRDPLTDNISDCVEVGFSQKFSYSKDMLVLKSKEVKFITQKDGTILIN